MDSWDDLRALSALSNTLFLSVKYSARQCPVLCAFFESEKLFWEKLYEHFYTLFPGTFLWP